MVFLFFLWCIFEIIYITIEANVCAKMTKDNLNNNLEIVQENSKIKGEYPQDLLFYRKSTKEHVLMSDDQEVNIFYSMSHKNSKQPTIVFIQGVGLGIYSWTDFWDQLYKNYNLIVIDSREKPTINLKKNKKCTVSRISLDIAEVLHYLKIEGKNTVLIASSFGVYYVAHCVAQKWFNPRGCIFIGPAIESSYPKVKTRLAFMLPTMFLEKIGKRIAKRFLVGKVAEGFQRKVYYERISDIDVKRWKQCSKMRFWNAAEDYVRIDCPVFIFSIADDKYHRIEGARDVQNLLKNSVLEVIPNYNYMHIKPGVEEFGEKLRKTISEL